MNTGTVFARGRVVIPQELRQRYRLKKGDKVHFIDYGGVVAIVPVPRNPVEESSGMPKGDTSLVEVPLKSRREGGS